MGYKSARNVKRVNKSQIIMKGEACINLSKIFFENILTKFEDARLKNIAFTLTSYVLMNCLMKLKPDIS